MVPVTPPLQLVLQAVVPRVCSHTKPPLQLLLVQRHALRPVLVLDPIGRLGWWRKQSRVFFSGVDKVDFKSGPTFGRTLYFDIANDDDDPPAGALNDSFTSDTTDLQVPVSGVKQPYLYPSSEACLSSEDDNHCGFNTVAGRTAAGHQSPVVVSETPASRPAVRFFPLESSRPQEYVSANALPAPPNTWASNQVRVSDRFDGDVSGAGRAHAHDCASVQVGLDGAMVRLGRRDEHRLLLECRPFTNGYGKFCKTKGVRKSSLIDGALASAFEG